MYSISRRSLYDRRKLVILEQKYAGRQLVSSSAARIINPGSSDQSTGEVKNDDHSSRLALGRSRPVCFKHSVAKCYFGRFVYNDTIMTTFDDPLFVVGRQQQQQRYFSSEYPNHQLVGLPSLSPTMESGSIASWNVKVGDTFGPGDSLCSVETDKATVDFEAQDEGVVAQILVTAGSAEIKVGSPILITVEDVADVAAFSNYTLASALTASGSSAPAKETPTPTTETPASSPSIATSPPVAPSVTSLGDGGRVVASPLAHLLAKEKGFSINEIVGTGPGGRIIAADVKEFVPSLAQSALSTIDVTTKTPAVSAAVPEKTAPVPTLPIPGSGYTDYPISESAKEIAARLMQSKRNVPHYYLTVDISLDNLLKLRSTLNQSGSVKIGVYELIIKAAALSMKTVPSVNGSWLDSVVRVYDSVDINVVVGSGDTLSTPVIRDCASKGLLSISQSLNDAVAATTGADVSEPIAGSIGTFTIINLGMYGIKSCAPIIREPQSAALAIGAIENRIVPADGTDEDELYKQSVMVTATIACDHRVVDGAVGAQWLSTFKSHVENPTTLLL